MRRPVYRSASRSYRLRNSSATGQEASTREGPIGSVKGLVVDIHEVDVIEDAPFHALGQVGFDSWKVGDSMSSRFPFGLRRSPNIHRPRRQNERTDRVTVDLHARWRHCQDQGASRLLQGRGQIDSGE